MMADVLLQAALLLFLTGALLSGPVSMFSRQTGLYLSGVLGLLASLAGTGSGILALVQPDSFSLFVPGLQLPFATLALTVDPLAAFFIFLISLAGIPVSLYSIGYLQAEYQDRSTGTLGTLYHLFMLSMLLVVTASSALSFLVFWECMALFSFCLVIFDIRSEVSRRAGFVYLVMTHLGTAFLLLMFLLLAQQSGGLSFESFAANSAQLPPGLKSLLFGCAIIGFGAKAGLIPLHIWLPEAHPAAPSHVSALMSGVMLKTAVYGFLRCVFEFFGPLPPWWGVTLVCIALTTAVLGITYASVENDLKRLLAYSSIENMGIVFLAIGLAMIFSGSPDSPWTGLFLTAGLLHCLNHSVFKSLLFMAAGAVLSTAHTRSLENLGGLIHRMPVTGVLFLTGALAICALPPLNGFLGEWLIFQGLILSTKDASELFRVLFPLSATLLGLTGAIAAATFVKAFSGAFLAMPRSHHAQHAREVSASMLGGMAIPAGLCLFLGVTPALSLPLLGQIASTLPGIAVDSYPLASVALDGFAAYAPLSLVMVLLAGMGLAWTLPRWLGKRTAVRREPTWSCGVTPASAFEYTPTGFSQPLEVVFSKFHATMNGYYEHFYIPVMNTLLAISRRLSIIQVGKIQVYLAYILLALVICLLWIKP